MRRTDIDLEETLARSVRGRDIFRENACQEEKGKGNIKLEERLKKKCSKNIFVKLERRNCGEF